jgi:hypothetical protein
MIRDESMNLLFKVDSNGVVLRLLIVWRRMCFQRWEKQSLRLFSLILWEVATS